MRTRRNIRYFPLPVHSHVVKRVHCACTLHVDCISGVSRGFLPRTLPVHAMSFHANALNEIHFLKDPGRRYVQHLAGIIFSRQLSSLPPSLPPSLRLPDGNSEARNSELQPRSQTRMDHCARDWRLHADPLTWAPRCIYL